MRTRQESSTVAKRCPHHPLHRNGTVIHPPYSGGTVVGMEAMRLGYAHAQRYDALHEGLAMAGEGWALEMGVHRGTTLRMIAAERPDKVVGFDSFQGLPEDWVGGWTRGTFALEELPEIPGVDIVPGWFKDTVPAWSGAHPGRIAFLHIDCDLYSSTRDVLSALEERITSGTVIVFDEYCGYEGWEDHEARAWAEFVDRTDTAHRMITAPGVNQAIMVIE